MLPVGHDYTQRTIRHPIGFCISQISFIKSIEEVYGGWMSMVSVYNGGNTYTSPPKQGALEYQIADRVVVRLCGPRPE